MLRHERLHTRAESTRYASSQAGSVTGPITPESMQRVDVNGDSDSTPFAGTTGQEQVITERQTANSGLQLSAPTADLDFELIWPDSEDLFQTIMSPNAFSFPSESTLMMDHSLGTPCSFDDRAPSIDAIPSGANHRAVRDVSRMIASWVS